MWIKCEVFLQEVRKIFRWSKIREYMKKDKFSVDYRQFRKVVNTIFIRELAFWAEWLASLRHLSLKATNFARPCFSPELDRKLNSKKIASVWISFRFNHFLAIWLAVSLKQLTYSVSLHNCIYQSYAVRVAVHKSSSSVKSKVG